MAHQFRFICCMSSLIALVSFVNGQGQCTTDTFKTIDETFVGEIVNFPLPSTQNWNWDVVRVAGIPSLSYEDKQTMKDYFVAIRNNTHVSFRVSKMLDKEYLFVLFQVKVGNIVLNLNCSNVPLMFTVVVDSVNEFPPQFGSGAYFVNVSESKPVNSTVFYINDVTDRDIQDTQRFRFRIEADSSALDGSTFFGLETASSRNITLRKALDYDDLKNTQKPTQYVIIIVVQDEGGMEDRATLTLSIINADDLPPVFTPYCNPNMITSSCKVTYTTTIDHEFKGPLTSMSPGEIGARDLDDQHAVSFRFVPDTEDAYRYFSINSSSGVVSVPNPLSKNRYLLNIEVEEVSVLRRSAQATLLVELASNASLSPPTVGKSTAEDNGDNKQMIIIIIAVIAILVIATLSIVLAVVYFKRLKTVKPGDMKTNSPTTSEEILNSEKDINNSKQDLINTNATFITAAMVKNNQLPPIEKVDMSTEMETTKKRSRRRKKNKEPEIFDGTKEYQMQADDEFLKSGDKTKIKRSSRSIKEHRMDPKYWITVHNDNQD